MFSVVTIYRKEDKHLIDGLGRCLPEGVDWILLETIPSDVSMNKGSFVGKKIVDNIEMVFLQWYYKDFSFSKAKNYAIERAKYDIVLVLDTDDRILRDINIYETCLNAFKENPKLGGIYFNVISPVGQSGHINSGNQIRMFRKQFRYRYSVHEQIINDIEEKGFETAIVPYPIFHIGYTDLSLEHYGKKIKRNINLLINDLKTDSSNPYLHFMLSNAYSELRESGFIDYFENGKIVHRKADVL